MGLLDALQRVFGPKGVDLEKRFWVDQRRWEPGNNGKFNLVKDKESSKKYLIKVIDPEKTKKYRSKFPGKGYQSELEISSSFDHKGIFSPVETGVLKSSEEFLLYDTDGWRSLENLIVERDKTIRKHMFSLIHQLAQALFKIHEAGFVHRDLCPRNIYVDSDGARLKILEFGYAIPDEASYGKVKNRAGTPLYMAPEIVRMRETNRAVDIFAYGITIFRLLCYKHPWGVEENSSKSTLQFDIRPAEDIRRYLPKFKEAKALAIAKLLEVNTDERYSNIKQFLMSSGIR